MLVQIGYVLDIRSDRFPETFYNRLINQITCVTAFAGRTPIRTYRRTVLMGQIPRHAAVAAR